MVRSLLTLFERSGDEYLGQTLIRLASLAAASHQYETTLQIQNEATQEKSFFLEDDDPHRVVHRPRTDAGPIRMEADR